jgi:hypothetical protein
MDSGVGWGITGNGSYAAVDGLFEDSHGRAPLLNVIHAAHCHSFKEETSFDRALSALPLALFTLQSLNLHVKSVASNINPRTFPRFWHVKALLF